MFYARDVILYLSAKWMHLFTSQQQIIFVKSVLHFQNSVSSIFYTSFHPTCVTALCKVIIHGTKHHFFMIIPRILRTLDKMLRKNLPPSSTPPQK